jgi:hypothetical protein
LTETSDKEIYHAVIDSITARENLVINGGDDVDDDGPVEPHPTQPLAVSRGVCLMRGSTVLNELREWAGDLAKVAGKKRKRTFLLQSFLGC